METPEQFCTSATPILRIVGYVVFGIKVVVPIILIIIGMVDLAKAVAAKEEKEIKTAQQGLVKKAIAAVLVFLVVSIVGVLMGIIGDKKYEKCMPCVNYVFGDKCQKALEEYENGHKEIIPDDGD